LHIKRNLIIISLEISEGGVIVVPRSAVLNLRIEPEIKADAEKLFGSFGLTVTDAVNVFLRQSLIRGGFPFEIVRNKPNAVTQAAIAEAELLLYDQNAKSFTSMDELRADLLSDEDDDV
jgi:DNA-damage-inducible protein J